MIVGQTVRRGRGRRVTGLCLAAAVVLPAGTAGTAHAAGLPDASSAPASARAAKATAAGLPDASSAPASARAPKATAPAPKAVCSKRTGPYQRQVERWLHLTVDGKQSRADCLAVAAFQKDQGIKPALGYAGPATWSRMMLLAAGDDPDATGKCPVRSYRVACVDLDRQLTWVQKGDKILFGPVPMRSGRPGHRTRPGWHRVYWRHRHHWSTLYNTPMPYAQFFDRGEAFHAVYGSIFTTTGSWGCVNLRLADARRLWSVLKNRDRVYVWGRRPGS